MSRAAASRKILTTPIGSAADLGALILSLGASAGALAVQVGFRTVLEARVTKGGRGLHLVLGPDPQIEASIQGRAGTVAVTTCRRRIDDQLALRRGAGPRLARAPAPDACLMTMDARLRPAIARALRDSGLSRGQCAAEMATLLQQPRLSAAMLDAYASESKTSHKLTVERLAALIRVTDARWLLDLVAQPLGLLVLEGDEAAIAELGHIDAYQQELEDRKRALLASLPVRRRADWRSGGR